MDQLKLPFDLSGSGPTVKKPNEIYAEDIYTGIDFILIPLFVLAAKIYKTAPLQIGKLKRENILLKAFCHNPSIIDAHLALLQIREYLDTEGGLTKIHSKQSLRGNNILGAKAFEDMIIQGATFFYQIELQNGISGDVSQMRTNLPISPIPLYFSKAARYLINGLKDRYWYRDNAEITKQLFKHFPEDLFPKLLAATSIRNEIGGNVTKAFRALDQFYKNEVHDVFIGKKGEKKVLKNHFPGHLDAVMMQLALVKAGKGFGSGKKNSARKITAFAEAMEGLPNAVVVDIWLMRAFNTDVLRFYKNRMISTSPVPRLYDAIEWYCQKVAGRLSMEPREISAMLWSGIRSEFNQRQTRYTDYFERKLSFGMFSDQYGELMPGENGIYFAQK